jgi:glycosyltransferase involved in cell wall biosynthesis
MRLLLVTRGFPPRSGGVETLGRQLAEGFAERGAEVTVVTFGGRIARPTIQRDRPYRVLRLPSRGGSFEWSGRLVPLLRRLDADVCHVHNLHSSVAAGVWAAGRHPYVLTAHYHGDGHSLVARLAHRPYRPLARRIVAGAAAVTAVSASEADLVRRDFGVQAEVIPNGIELRPPILDEPSPTILVVSRLEPYKRVDAVVRALPALDGFRLHIVGDGPHRPGLERLAVELGVRGRVTFAAPGLSDVELHRLYGASSVYVNLSGAEAFSYTVLEALAAGTPVVTSGDGALAEWSRRFPAAVCAADPAEPRTVVAAIKALGGRRVRVDLSRYALPTMLDAYQRVYERVAQPRVLV